MGRIGLGVLLVFATAALYEAFRPPLAPTPWSLGSPPGRAATHRGQQWRATTTMSSIYRSRSRINYYEVLGIPPDATRETIKRAYHQKAKTLHPDLSRTVNTTGEFLLVKEAYETLHNLEMRIEFDRKKAVGEVAELAVNVGEILAADLAIPLARDVAIPLIKATITHIDQALIKQLKPLANSVLQQSTMMYENIKQEAERRAAIYKAEQAVREVEHRKALKAMLLETSEMAEKAKQSVAMAYSTVQRSMQAEQDVRQRLQQEEAAQKELTLQMAEVVEVKRALSLHYEDVASQESQAQKELDKLVEEANRASEHVETDEAVVGEAQSELNEAEEALRLAQLRVEAAKQNFTVALSRLADSKLKKSASDAKMEAGSLILTAAKLAVKAHRNELDDVLGKESELKQLHERHREVQRDLQQALSVTSRDRVRAESEAERAETSAKMLHERMARLADRLEKSEQKSAARDYVASAAEQPFQSQQAATSSSSPPSPLRVLESVTLPFSFLWT